MPFMYNESNSNAEEEIKVTTWQSHFHKDLKNEIIQDDRLA